LLIPKFFTSIHSITNVILFLKPWLKLSLLLTPHYFLELTDKFLLNKRAIKEIQPYFKRKVIVKTDLKIEEQLIVSRLKVTEFMNWIEQS
jgi:two-component system response regulator LytT